MSAVHKNECPVAAGQVVKSISIFTADFIARAARYATVNGGFNILFLFLVLALQFVAMAWGVL